MLGMVLTLLTNLFLDIANFLTEFMFCVYMCVYKCTCIYAYINLYAFR